jgi:hypothetical protein
MLMLNLTSKIQELSCPRMERKKTKKTVLPGAESPLDLRSNE